VVQGGFPGAEWVGGLKEESRLMKLRIKRNAKKIDGRRPKENQGKRWGM